MSFTLEREVKMLRAAILEALAKKGFPRARKEEMDENIAAFCSKYEFEETEVRELLGELTQKHFCSLNIPIPSV